MSALAIAQVNLTRLFRDRMSLFFIFLLPIVLIVVLGVMYGGRTSPRLGVVAIDVGQLGSDLVTGLRTGDMRLEIREFADRAALAGAVEQGTIEMGIVALGTTLLMGADWGDPIAVVALIVAAVVAASGIALLVVGFTKNEEQAGGLTSIVAMIFAVLGGSFFPLSQAPEGLAQVSLLTPHAWFLRGVNDLASNEGLAIIMPWLVVLTTIGLVTGGLGLLRAGKVVTAR